MKKTLMNYAGDYRLDMQGYNRLLIPATNSVVDDTLLINNELLLVRPLNQKSTLILFENGVKVNGKNIKDSAVLLASHDSLSVSFINEWAVEKFPLSQISTLFCFLDYQTKKSASTIDKENTVCSDNRQRDKCFLENERSVVLLIDNNNDRLMDMLISGIIDPQKQCLHSIFTFIRNMESYWIAYFLLSQVFNDGNDSDTYKLYNACKIYGVSESYFRKLCHNAFTCGPKKQLRMWRAAHSALQLIEKDNSIATIAGNNGYSSSSHFSSEIKSIFGITPREFKNWKVCSMNKLVKKKQYCNTIILLVSMLFCFNSSAELFSNSKKESGSNRTLSTSLDEDNFYVASNNSVQQLFYVLGGALNKPIIVSTEAAKKRVSGNFDLSKPKELLTTLAARTGLIWYDDGSSIYVYDTSEIQSSVVRLAYAPFDRLVAFLQSSGLYDPRFPLRSNGRAGSFYASGPPVYVELITAAAKYIDATYARPGTGETTIRVIKLKNTFVNDRSYTQRDVPVTIPGVATVLNQLLNSGRNSGGGSGNLERANITVDNDTQAALEAMSANQNGNFPPLPSFNSASNRSPVNTQGQSSQDYINIVAYSDTNSLLVQGSARQVGFVEDLVTAIDIPKQQIQLSLWIIDISKDDINELGVRWQGSAKINNTGITFNTSSLTPENSVHFLADVTALARKGNAQIVSRPEILTQENTPALFDNNSSFYAKLVGERNSSLEKVTYGTMISVLPRFAQRQQEIEMILNIQDGGLPLNIDGKAEYVDNLPTVHNTQISTEARVPVGYSLLVGGYSRDQDEQHNIGIPLLKDIPYLGRLFDYSYVSNKKMVRLFLIQPRLMASGETWQGYESHDPVLGRTVGGDDVTLKSTVSMLRNTMK